MFVGHAPAKYDDDNGIPNSGKNGKLLRTLIGEAGISLRDCYFTNCLRCCIFESKPKIRQWKQCKQHFVRELEDVNPKIVIAVGATAVSWLTGHSGVMALRNKLLPMNLDGFELDYGVFAMRQPAVLYRTDWQGGERKEADIQALRTSLVEDLRYIRDSDSRQNNSLSAAEDYQTAYTPEDVDRFLSEMEYYSELAFDFETTTLRHPQESDKLVAAGFSFGQGVGRAIPLYAKGIMSPCWWDDDYLESELIPKVRDFMQRKKLFGHNAIQFDQKWSRAKLGIDKLNLITDTQFLSYVLKPEGSHKLESLAVTETSMVGWKHEFTLDDTQQLCEYLCKDVDATYRLRQLLEPRLTDLQRWLLHELIIPLAQELFEIEWRGVSVDKNALDDLGKYIRGQISKCYEQIRQEKAVKKFELEHLRGLNAESHNDVRVLLRDYLRLPCYKKTDGGEYSTDKEVLTHYESNSVVASISKIRGLAKLRGTYVDGMSAQVIDGRIHTSYLPHRTVTGRLASQDPNLQNLPRADTAGAVLEDPNAIKKAFVAEEGYVLLQADYSQAELRTLASVSFDTQMIDIFQRGEDIHTATAAKAYGIKIEEVSKAQRFEAKSINFGVVYGMSLESLAKKFAENGSSEEAAVRFYSFHRKTFTRAWAWLDEQEEIILRCQQQETFFGRRRTYDVVDNHAIRQAYNFPIQSLASDILEIALIRCAVALRQQKLPAYIVLTVHDSLVFAIKKIRFWEIAEVIRDTMEGVLFDWLRVPMTVDLEVGPSWGELEKVDLEQRKIGDDIE
jgi:DNA polymerase-1